MDWVVDVWRWMDAWSGALSVVLLFLAVSFLAGVESAVRDLRHK